MVAFDVQSICLAASGIIINSMILISYIRDQCKGKAFTTCDQILLSMACTSIVIECSVITENLVNMLYEEAYIYVNINYIIMVFMIDFSFWQSALLSSYYCGKLCNISHCFFQRMNRMMSSSTLLLLLGSAAFSFLINVGFFGYMCLGSPGNVTHPVIRVTNVWDLSITSYVFNIFLGCCLPFLVNFTCISLSVGSILKHVCRMRKNVVQSGSSPLIGGPVQAVSTMALCALLDLIYCVDFVGQVLSNFDNGDVLDAVAWVIFMLYPIIRPSILIIRNPLLKRRMREMCFPSCFPS